MICITLGVLNVYEYFWMQIKIFTKQQKSYQTQVVIFFVFLINIFIVSAESYRSTTRAVPTVLSMVLAGVAVAFIQYYSKIRGHVGFFQCTFLANANDLVGINNEYHDVCGCIGYQQTILDSKREKRHLAQKKKIMLIGIETLNLL